jgi:hypothetical protein
MSAFDRFPETVRRRLDGGSFNYDARAIASAARRFRLSEAELVAFIDALDAHSRAVLAGAAFAATLGSNRLDDQSGPDEAALVATARRAAATCARVCGVSDSVGVAREKMSKAC